MHRLSMNSVFNQFPVVTNYRAKYFVKKILLLPDGAERTILLVFYRRI